VGCYSLQCDQDIICILIVATVGPGEPVVGRVFDHLVESCSSRFGRSNDFVVGFVSGVINCSSCIIWVSKEPRLTVLDP